MIYTVELHRTILKQMIKTHESNGDLSNLCPEEISGGEVWENSVCEVCCNFVGLEEDKYDGWSCPCFVLGRDEALRITRERLEE